MQATPGHAPHETSDPLACATRGKVWDRLGFAGVWGGAPTTPKRILLNHFSRERIDF